MPKRYEKCVASFLVPFIDKWGESFCSSPGSTPKFILPFPLGIPEKNFTPHPHTMLLFGVLLSNLKSINVWADAQDKDEHIRRAKPKGTGSEGISPTPQLAGA